MCGNKKQERTLESSVASLHSRLSLLVAKQLGCGRSVYEQHFLEIKSHTYPVWMALAFRAIHTYKY